MYSQHNLAAVNMDATVTGTAADLLTWSLSNSTAPSQLGISSVAWDRPLLSAKSSFQWAFSTPSTRPIYY